MSRALGFFASATPAPPPPAPNLDAYTTGVFGVYGLARMLSAYTGHAVLVRRDSDNTTANIDFLVGGGLDTTTLLAFAGSGSAYVQTFYDQSGGGNNFAQATNSLQPRIVNAGAYDGVLRFDGVDDTMVCVNTHSTPTGMAAYIAGTLRNTANRQIWLASDSGSGGSTSTLGVVIWDYDPSSTNYRNIIATNTGANLIIARAQGSNLLNANVNAIVVDFTQSADSSRAPYYVNGSEPSIIYNDVGTVPTSTVLDNVEPFNLAARGGANSSAINVFELVIYQVAQTGATVSAISSILNAIM